MSDLRLGDCLDPLTGLASLPDKSVDHVIADPPYEAEAHTLARRIKRRSVGRDGMGILAEAPLAFGAITDEQRRSVGVQLARLARRWIILFCQVEAAMKWRGSLEAGGARYVRTGIWVKPDGQPQLSGDRPGMGYESIVIAHASVPGRMRWNGGGKRAVWTFTRCQDGLHQTQKPLGLMEALTLDFTDRGDLICDPFAGSGSTGVAALRHGRRFLGWELDEKYHATACARLADVREQMALAL